jgi:hypothetical protein
MTEIERQITAYLGRHGWSGFRVGKDELPCMWQVQKEVYRINLDTHAKIDSDVVHKAYAEALSQIEVAAEVIKAVGAPHDVTGNVISNEHCHLFRYTLRFS